MKKARKFFEANQVEHHLHDYRQDGLTEDWLSLLVDHIDWAQLINKRSTTWKQLTDPEKASAEQFTPISAALIIQHPTLLKRPIINIDNHWVVGYDENQWLKYF